MARPIILPEPPKKVVVKDATISANVESTKRLQQLTSKAMGFPKLRRMGDGSPIPHQTITEEYIRIEPILDGYGDPVLDGYGEPITVENKYTAIRTIYKIKPYMDHYDSIHFDGYGERIATRTPPPGLSISNNPHLDGYEKIELEEFISLQEDVPKDWESKKAIPTRTLKIFQYDLQGGAYFDADYGITFNSGTNDIASWEAYKGDITLHQPSYYGKSGNTPSISNTLFEQSEDGYRNCVYFDANNSEALISNEINTIFNGDIDTNKWTVITQLVRSDPSDGVLFCASGSSSGHNIVARHTQSAIALEQIDNNGDSANAEGYNIPVDTETVSIILHDGKKITTWENNDKYSVHPITVGALDQMDSNMFSIGGRCEGGDTWTSYLSAGIRRMIILPFKINPGQVVLLQNLWMGLPGFSAMAASIEVPKIKK